MTTPPKRRWFRFGLRMMFVAVTLVGCVLGWPLSIVRERKAVLAEIANEKGAMVLTLAFAENDFQPGEGLTHTDLMRVSNLRKWLGDEAIIGIVLYSDTEPALIRRTENAFPESQIYVYIASDRPPLIPMRTAKEFAFRDRLVFPENLREKNRGTIFKTGLIEK
jgi:hypothetical protein